MQATLHGSVSNSRFTDLCAMAHDWLRPGFDLRLLSCGIRCEARSSNHSDRFTVRSMYSISHFQIGAIAWKWSIAASTTSGVATTSSGIVGAKT